MCVEKSVPKAVASVMALWLSQPPTIHANAIPSYGQDDIPKGRMLKLPFSGHFPAPSLHKS